MAAVVFLSAVVLGAVYHVFVWQSGEMPSVAIRLFYHVIILIGFVALWARMAHQFRGREASPLKSFWVTTLIGFLLIVTARLIVGISMPANIEVNVGVLGFEYGTGVPLTLATVVKMNLLSILKVGFAFFLLLRLRDLVLFKRTRRSQRNWYLMLALMAAGSLAAMLKDPSSEAGWVQLLAAIPAIALASVNAFRVSWIVYLNFREKASGIGLSVLLIVVLSTLLGSGQTLPGFEAYVTHYSYTLELFTRMAIGFGILYSVTAFLFLVFHLPTTSDFQRKAGEVTAMHSLTNLVGQVFDPDKLYYTITATPVEAGNADAAWLAIPDPGGGSLKPVIVSCHNVTPSAVDKLVDLTALYDEAGSEREPVVLEEAPADHRVGVGPGERLGSLLIVPLVVRNEMLGALFVAKDVTHGFEKDDVEAISVYAAQAAIAMENARLFEQQIEKERLARELDIARDVQRRLLPQRLPVLHGTTIAASSVSALEVGGDYYDFMELDENRLAFIVADVSGKGTSAAFYMAELQGIFRSVCRLVPSPAAFLYHANAALASSLERHVFISVIYGVLDTSQESLVIARGGHCPAAAINLHGEARYIRTRGLGLGLDRTELFEKSIMEEKIALQPGDVFALYTDGVVESRNEQGDEYGYDRLLQALRRHRHEDAADLHHALLEDLNGFLNHTDYGDDMTLVVLKWHGFGLQETESARSRHSVLAETATRQVEQD